MKDKRDLMIGVILIIFVTLLSGCCSHSWAAPTCVAPATCTKCGETEGSPLGHDWSEATCTAAVTCERCGSTKGEPLGHDWKEATCTSPMTCARCGLTEGSTIEHKWVEATCISPMTCSVCGQTEGETLEHEWKDATCTESAICKNCGKEKGNPLGHSVEEWQVEYEPSCTENGLKTGICTRCGELVEENIETIDHVPSEWIVTVSATSTSAGEREIHCINCDKVLETETYELSEDEIKDAFKSECVEYYYDDIARYPDRYVMEKVTFRGKVIQVMESGDTYTLRINVTEGRYNWTNTMLVEYEKRDSSEPRILEDDIIRVYGYCLGTTTYTTIFGASVTIPAMLATYVDY